MKIIIPNIIVIVCILFLTGCREDEASCNTNIISGFQSHITLNGDPVSGFVQFCPSSISLVDTIIIFSDHCDNQIFHCYNKEMTDYIGAFGNYGRGPSEFTAPETTGDYKFTDNSIELLLTEPNLNKVSYINIKHGLDEKKEFITSTYNLPDLISFPCDCSIINDSIIVGKSSFGPGSIFLYNIINKDINWINFYPPVSKPVKKEKLSELYNSVIKESTYYNKIVSAMLSFPRIDIFNYDGSHDLSIVVENDNPEPDFSDPTKLMSDNTFQYYTDLFLGIKHIYALTINMQQKDIMSKKIAPGTIHIFNWDGSPVYSIQLDEFISRFIVDEDNNIIIAICPFSNNQVKSYKIP